MKQGGIIPTGQERSFDRDEIIVSKTNTKGIITYANSVFLRVAGYTEAEVLGRPHNIIRHPEMPKCVFKLLWDTLEQGEEIFAYVINLCKNGDHYWVLAHVTPSYDAQGNIIGYHSSRRVPERHAIEKIAPIYKMLKGQEDSNSDWRTGMEQASLTLGNHLKEQGVRYDQFVFAL